MIYHLDYHERPNWELLRDDLLRTSRRKAQELVLRYAGAVSPVPTRRSRAEALRDGGWGLGCMNV